MSGRCTGDGIWDSSGTRAWTFSPCAMASALHSKCCWISFFFLGKNPPGKYITACLIQRCRTPQLYHVFKKKIRSWYTRDHDSEGFSGYYHFSRQSQSTRSWSSAAFLEVQAPFSHKLYYTHNLQGKLSNTLELGFPGLGKTPAPPETSGLPQCSRRRPSGHSALGRGGIFVNHLLFYLCG